MERGSARPKRKGKAPSLLERHIGLVVLHQSGVILAFLLKGDRKIFESDVVDDLVLLAGKRDVEYELWSARCELTAL